MGALANQRDRGFADVDLVGIVYRGSCLALLSGNDGSARFGGSLAAFSWEIVSDSRSIKRCNEPVFRTDRNELVPKMRISRSHAQGTAQSLAPS